MIPSMTRLTIAVPDQLAEQIKATAGGNVSAWLTKVAKEALLREEAAAIAAYEAERRDDDWERERFTQ